MPVEYKAPSITIDLKGKVDLLKQNIQGRTVCLVLQGKSIEELENKINKFKNLDVCWAAINRFDVIQENILDKISKSLEVVMDIAEVQHAEDYCKVLRIPRLNNFIVKNKQGAIIITKKLLNEIKELDLISYENITLSNSVIIDTDTSELTVPNSLTIYLLLLAKYGAKRVILFGCDGFGNPSAFKDTPLWSAEEMQFDKADQSISSYYCPESVLRHRRIGFGNITSNYLHSDGPTFNDQFKKIYDKYCTEKKITPIEILNCNPNSMFTIFKKISYEETIKLCQ